MELNYVTVILCTGVRCIVSYSQMQGKTCVTTLDAEQRPTFSPPGCATSRLRPANQLHFLPYANAICRMLPELSCVDEPTKVGRRDNGD